MFLSKFIRFMDCCQEDQKDNKTEQKFITKGIKPNSGSRKIRGMQDPFVKDGNRGLLKKYRQLQHKKITVNTEHT